MYDFRNISVVHLNFTSNLYYNTEWFHVPRDNVKSYESSP